MPLPPALAAKLRKRGLIQKTKPSKTASHTEEEVIAESYDQDDLPDQKRSEEFGKGCPNLESNVFHDCGEYCRRRWGDKKVEADAKRERRRLKMLVKYPLPDDWHEIFDGTTGCYYYWHVTTEEVSWLPPSHPRAKVGECASKARLAVRERMEQRMKEKAKGGGGRGGGGGQRSDEDRSGGSDSDGGERERDRRGGGRRGDRRRIGRERDRRESNRSGARRDRDRSDRRRDSRRKVNEKKSADDSLDPMDPAAYSDVPRGTWSAGLPDQNEAKTGADVTASGPLYQMRPYPSPGAILRANKVPHPDKQSTAKSDDDEDQAEEK